MSDPAAQVWAALPLPGLVLDGQGAIADLNPAAEQFLNASARALRGRPLPDRLRLEPALDGAIARVRRDLSPLAMNAVEVRGAGGVPVSCNIHIAPLSGRAEHILLLLDPRHIADQLGRALSVGTAAKSAIGMAAMLSHEIKNPLAGITGAAQLLAQGLGREDRELTELIVAESRRIAALLDQVEQFGNLRPPERRALNIHDLLDRARRSAAVGFAAHMRMVEDFDPSLPATFVDGDQMVQLFLNLLRNAAEAAGTGGGTIRLRTFYDRALRRLEADGSQRMLPLQVEIVDDGPGLPPDIAADVFEPFVSGRANGTGLGLALVGKIVSDHGAWISIDSVPGRTVLRLSLPVAPDADADISQQGAG